MPKPNHTEYHAGINAYETDKQLDDEINAYIAKAQKDGRLPQDTYKEPEAQLGATGTDDPFGALEEIAQADLQKVVTSELAPKDIAKLVQADNNKN